VAGWQQGYVVPAGAADEIELRFLPDRSYRVGLLMGLLGVLLVIGLAVVPTIKRAGPESSTVRPPSQVVIGVLVVCVLAGVGGWAGLGIGAILGSGAWRLRSRRLNAQTALGVLSALAYLVAGLGVAQAPAYSEVYAAPLVWVQLACLFAIAAVGVSSLFTAAEGAGSAPAGEESLGQESIRSEDATVP
jgi:arabinofuranan 3-O-arabinosyltransferase